MEFIVGVIIFALALWGLNKLADAFEDRHFLFWLIFYLAAGSLTIMILHAASSVGQ